MFKSKFMDLINVFYIQKNSDTWKIARIWLSITILRQWILRGFRKNATWVYVNQYGLIVTYREKNIKGSTAIFLTNDKSYVMKYKI